jgi:hypothetical protein
VVSIERPSLNGEALRVLANLPVPHNVKANFPCFGNYEKMANGGQKILTLARCSSRKFQRRGALLVPFSADKIKMTTKKSSLRPNFFIALLPVSKSRSCSSCVRHWQKYFQLPITVRGGAVNVSLKVSNRKGARRGSLKILAPVPLKKTFQMNPHSPFKIKF